MADVVQQQHSHAGRDERLNHGVVEERDLRVGLVEVGAECGSDGRQRVDDQHVEVRGHVPRPLRESATAVGDQFRQVEEPNAAQLLPQFVVNGQSATVGDVSRACIELRFGDFAAAYRDSQAS